jgi:hypothetical protein
MRNMLKITTLAATTALASFGGLTPASATIVDVTYTGGVSSGRDTDGLFGPPGTDLTGDPFKAFFVFDTTLGSTTTSPTENQALGGTVLSLPSPSLSAALTINGHSFDVSGFFFGTNSWRHRSGEYSRDRRCCTR